MRISDWSSDVCSSDLGIPAHRVAPGRDLRHSAAARTARPEQYRRAPAPRAFLVSPLCWRAARTAGQGARRPDHPGADRRCRYRRVACWLETATSANVPIYERLGFVTQADWDIAGEIGRAHV